MDSTWPSSDIQMYTDCAWITKTWPTLLQKDFHWWIHAEITNIKFHLLLKISFKKGELGQNYKPKTSLSKGSMFCNDRNSRFAFKDFFLIEFFSHQDHKVAQMKLLKIQRTDVLAFLGVGGGGRRVPWILFTWIMKIFSSSRFRLSLHQTKKRSEKYFDN